MGDAEGVCQAGGDGPLRGPGHHHLHRAQHSLHGHGALPHDGGVRERAERGEPGRELHPSPSEPSSPTPHPGGQSPSAAV